MQNLQLLHFFCPVVTKPACFWAVTFFVTLFPALFLLLAYQVLQHMGTLYCIVCQGGLSEQVELCPFIGRILYRAGKELWGADKILMRGRIFPDAAQRRYGIWKTCSEDSSSVSAVTEGMCPQRVQRRTAGMHYTRLLHPALQTLDHRHYW